MEDSGGLLLCRVCLERGATIPIFELKDSPDPNVYSKLCQCIGEKIEDTSGFPRHICKLCLITLNTAVKFIKKFKASTEMLSKCQQVVKEEPQDIFCIEFDALDNEVGLFTDFLDENDIEPKHELIKKPKETSRKLLPKKTVPKAEVLNKIQQKNINRKTCKPKVTHSSEAIKTEIKDGDEHSNINGAERLCDVCGKTFANQERLHKHKMVHHSPKAQCPHCPKVLSNHSQLVLHIHRMHSSDEEKKHVCSTCQRRFRYNKDLKKHVKQVHEKKRTLVPCSLCDRKLSGKNAVQMHIRSAHTGERPEVCSVCGKGFCTPGVLKEHIRLHHTGERPFKCLVCAKAFYSRCNLKSHVKHNHRVSQLDEEMLKKLSSSKINYFKHMQP